jgi:putative membrane protein
LCSKLVDGFSINGFFGALFFSIILSVLQSIVFKISGESK